MKCTKRIHFETDKANDNFKKDWKQIENGLKTDSKCCLVKCISKQMRFKIDKFDVAKRTLFKTDQTDDPNAP